MRHHPASFPWLLAGLLACGDSSSTPTTVAATQLTLRTHASADVQRSWQSFTVRVNGTVKFTATYKDTLSWPIDIQLVARDDAQAGVPVDVVVRAADDQGVVIAEDRLVTGFVAAAARQAELYLRPCSARAVCEPDPDCTGRDCLRCVEDTCERVGITPAGDLAPLDTGPALDPVPICEAAVTCNGGSVMECDKGRLREREQCAFVCREGACTGECVPGEALPRCDPDDPLVPQRCGEDGQWAVNEAALDTDGRCPYLCEDGACTGSCKPESTLCEGGIERACDAHGTLSDGKLCDQFCGKASCAQAPSCSRDPRCGASNASCCSALEVPGGTFFRGNDSVDETTEAYPATVSAFKLDEFEVTVGRFRRWVESFGDGLPPPYPREGQGRDPHDENDPGWSEALNTNLPQTRTQIEAQLVDCAFASYALPSTVANNERLPITCVSWYLAQAFCIWDGGRLPTLAEWQFAASGGNEQRYFPWSKPANSKTLDHEHACYAAAEPQMVGLATGLGRWGHADAAGNVAEWVSDAWREQYLVPCVDCSVYGLTDSRTYVGGDYAHELLGNADRSAVPAMYWDSNVGFRCARN